MQTIIHAFAFAAICVFVYVTAAFGISRLIGKRNDLADVAWGGGFIVIALATFLPHAFGAAASWPGRVATILVCIWGSRLTVHIWRRYVKSSGDRRYAELQAKWGKQVELKSYLIVFLAQGFLMLLISAPVIVVNSLHPVHASWQWIGVLIWLVGFYFEARGDYELSKFLSNPKNKGKLMTSGLWRYTRHPNYFGEITQWWGIFVLALAAPYGWLGLAGSLTITVLILFVSGIPITERHYAGRADWEIYKARTSMLVPLPPRK